MTALDALKRMLQSELDALKRLLSSMFHLAVFRADVCNNAMDAQVQERWIGPDLVRIEGDDLAIYSRREMPDWVVREFCQPAIWLQDQKFFLRAREPVSGRFQWRYRLSPWPEGARQSASYSIFYSQEYVLEREKNFRSALISASGRCLLLPFCPLLGFLWSGTKEQLASLGFVPRSITSFSIAVELGAMILLGVFIGYLGYWSVVNVLSFVVLVLDLVMRYDSLLRDRERQLGFLEWCVRR